MQQTYGVDNYFQTQEFQEKRKQVLGTEFIPMHQSGALEKYRQTSLQKYGTTHPSKSQIVKDKIRETTLKRWGVPNSLMLNHRISTSNIQEEIEELIKSWGFEIETNKYLSNDPRSNVDIYIPSKKIAIEYNGTHWHSTLNPFDNRRLLDYNHHFIKSDLISGLNIFLYHIFEFESSL